MVKAKTPEPDPGLAQLLAQVGELIVDGRLVKAPATEPPPPDPPATPHERGA